MSNRKPMSPKKVAVFGIGTALVAALTYIGFPITPTRGYFNFGEVAIFFIAFTIGWREAAICGAVGATIIDLILAPFFAPATLVAKAIEGAMAGMIIIMFIESKRKTAVRTAAFAAGGSLMIATYFIYEWTVLPLNLFSDPSISFYSGIGPALAEFPFNILQAVACGVIAVMLTKGIERAYPRIADLHD
jgi:uncharacterized membrane protein